MLSVTDLPLKQKYLHKIKFAQYDDYNFLITMRLFDPYASAFVNLIRGKYPNIFKLKLLDFPDAYKIDEFNYSYYVYAFECKQAVDSQYTSGTLSQRPQTEALELYAIRVDENNVPAMREALIKNYLPPFINFYYHKYCQQTSKNQPYVFKTGNSVFNYLTSLPIKSLSTGSNTIEINDTIKEVHF